MARLISFSDRISESAKLLSVETKSLIQDLKKSGIENDSTGLLLLNANTTTIDDLVSILESGCANGVPRLKLKAAASILKGEHLEKATPFSKQKMSVIDASSQYQTLTEIIKANRPVEQMGDRELIERYAQDKENCIEQELHKRAKGQNFIVLRPGKYEPGKEEIDIDLTMELLKSSRKRTNPSMIPIEGKILPVYKITELNPQDRIVEICPLCGETLYRGYCDQCELNFLSIGDDERAFINLISESPKFNRNNFSDRRAVYVSAQKGIEDLKQTWPSLAKKFDELKLVNNLPKLRIIMNRPSIADPFFQDGNRSFGNRTF